MTTYVIRNGKIFKAVHSVFEDKTYYHLVGDMQCPICGVIKVYKKGLLPTLSGPKRRWVCEKGHNFTTKEETENE